jgi:hypothetical protein
LTDPTNDPLANLTPHLDEISNAATKLGMDISNAMQPIVAQLASVQAAVEAQFADLARAAAQFAQQQELYAEVYPLLAERGWVESPSTPAILLDELMLRVRREGPEKINEWMVELYGPELCRRALEECLNRPSFVPWSRTLQKAMAAHERGEPELAIPIWLIAIDGICAVEFGMPDIFSKVTRSKERERLEADLGYDIAGDALAGLEVDGLLRVLSRLGRGGSMGSGQPDADVLPRRHDVLHGWVPSIGDEEYSIRCILVLANLKWMIELRDGRVADRARRKNSG